ncbi:MAG TPA: MBL fold metallo-hydrolase [Clostridia bacterium]
MRHIKISTLLFLSFFLLMVSSCTNKADNQSSTSVSKPVRSSEVFKCFPKGMYDSNSYVLGQNGEGIIIDAGVESNQIIDFIKTENLKIKYIILTHGHIDHVKEVEKLKDKLSTKILIHKKDADLFKANTSMSPDEFIEDGETLNIGSLTLEIIYTPGHSPGSICIKTRDKIFTGDTLFRESIGRTDFQGGSYEDIISSIKNKLLKLDDNIEVYPGHDGSTTIGYERKNNQFIQ